MTLRQLHDITRQEVARRLASRQAVLTDSPRQIVTPVRFGWCKITDATYASSGVYSVTEQWWHAGAGPADWADAISPPGLVDVEAREVRGLTTGAVDDCAPFWQQRRKDGAMETYIALPVAGAALPAKAAQNWSYPASGSASDDADGMFRVLCHPPDGEGGWDTETALTVYLPIPTSQEGESHSAIAHPNVVEGQVLRYVPDSDGANICISVYADAPIGTVRLWARKDGQGDPSHVPPGWQLCDGANDPQGNPVPDLQGRFVVNHKSGGLTGTDESNGLGHEGDYDGVGDTGGGHQHAHDDHTAHKHALYACQHTLELTYTGPWYILSDDEMSNDFSTDNAHRKHSQQDHRPPYYVVAYHVRVDNSEAWT